MNFYKILESIIYLLYKNWKKLYLLDYKTQFCPNSNNDMDTPSNRQPKGSKQNPKSPIKHCTRSFSSGWNSSWRRRESRGRHSTPTQHRAMKHLRGPRIHNRKSRIKNLRMKFMCGNFARIYQLEERVFHFNPPTAICCVSYHHQQRALRATSSLSLCCLFHNVSPLRQHFLLWEQWLS